MRIEIDIQDTYADTEVLIKTPGLTRNIEKLLSMLRMMDMQLAVKKG